MADTTRYRNRDRDTRAKRAHALDNSNWRHSIADSVFPPAEQRIVLNAIRDGVPVVRAAELVGLTFQAVYGRGRWDQAFSDALDEALGKVEPSEPVVAQPDEPT